MTKKKQWAMIQWENHNFKGPGWKKGQGQMQGKYYAVYSIEQWIRVIVVPTTLIINKVYASQGVLMMTTFSWDNSI